MSVAYFDAMTRKIEALNEADSIYAEIFREAVGHGQWSLWVDAREIQYAILSSGGVAESDGWRCIAAGSEAAVRAAARLMSS